MKNILIIAPHPDDETLGCGGTLLKLRSKKKNLLIITKLKNKKEYNSYNKEKELEKIKKKLNLKKIIRLEFTATDLNKGNLKDLINQISIQINKIKPDTIFAPHLRDAHSDHFYTTYALNHILKNFRYNFIQRCYLYETLSETNFNFANKQKFIPNVYFDISKYMNSKLKLLEVYKTEIKKHPFPRSKRAIKSLAILRGSESGFKYAESFNLIYERIK